MDKYFCKKEKNHAKQIVKNGITDCGVKWFINHMAEGWTVTAHYSNV